MAPSTTPNVSEFLILAIADNLLITQAQRVCPGISLRPVTTDLGEDVRTVLNRILREHGIVTQWLSKKTWLARMRDNRPAVLIECHVRAETPDAAATHGREVLKQLLDMMALRRGAAANLIAGVVTSQNERGRHRVRDAWIEHSRYRENLLGGSIAGEDVHALQASWDGLQANPRAQLWVSLYADAVRDPVGSTSSFDASTCSKQLPARSCRGLPEYPTHPATQDHSGTGKATTRSSRRRARFTCCCYAWLARPPAINCGMKLASGCSSAMPSLTKGRGGLPARAKYPRTPPCVLPSPAATGPSESNRH